MSVDVDFDYGGQKLSVKDFKWKGEGNNIIEYGTITDKIVPKYVFEVHSGTYDYRKTVASIVDIESGKVIFSKTIDWEKQHFKI